MNTYIRYCQVCGVMDPDMLIQGTTTDWVAQCLKCYQRLREIPTDIPLHYKGQYRRGALFKHPQRLQQPLAVNPQDNPSVKIG